MVVGLHLLRRSYFLPLTKKRRETVLYLQRNEKAYRMLRAGRPGEPHPPLHKPLKIYPTISDLRQLPHLRLHLPGPKNSPVYIQSLPEHCLKLKKIKKIFFKTKELLVHNRQSGLLGENSLRGVSPRLGEK